MNNVTDKNITERNVGANNFTALNPQLSNITVRNDVAENFSNFSDGTILLGKYVVKNRLPVISGEANIYICEYNGAEYIAKIYNRKDAVKPEIIEKLKNLDSPNVAKIYETGEHNGMSISILPYYKLGSLQGKKFSMKQLKRMLIPCINDALQALHNIGIFHKDLKPANIMMLSNGKGVALIDFGISSVIESGVSVLISSAGWAPGYSAPEALPPKCLYLEESDYYSFGITLYELFCGHMPYENLSQTDVERLLEIDGLPYPDNMPEELRDLITGLTYKDLRNRNRPDNPNRRWTYEEVKKWLAGEKQPVPGEASVSKKFIGASYTFNGKSYDDIDELIPALVTNWTEGKKQLTRGLLSGFFKNYNSEIASNIMDVEDEIKHGKDSDVAFWNLLYKLAPNMKKFFWKGKNYPSLQKFGQDMLMKLRLGDMSEKNLWDEIFANQLTSKYLKFHSQQKELINAVKALETTNKDRRDGLISYYQMAYILTGKAEFVIAEMTFSTPEDLAKHMNTLIDDSIESFEKFSSHLIDNNNKLNEEFEAWLIALGKRNELNNWKQNLQMIEVM